MAVMIPTKPNRFAKGSLEDIMFASLERLPDDYFVFHSMRITTVKSDMIMENEIDFVVFNRFLGIMCIECKAGNVRYEKGMWLYGNGMRMNNGGPYNQADANKWKLMDMIAGSHLGKLIERIRFFHAVWFPSVTKSDLLKMPLPPEGTPELALCMDDLENPLPSMERIFGLRVNGSTKTDISESEAEKLMRELLCPSFNVFPPRNFDVRIKTAVFNRMLSEQAAILNFLGEQKTAVINGAAGTGKTMIAVEKARRHAAKGERVLFLCYNSELRKHLEKEYGNKYIDYYTIDAFISRILGNEGLDYNAAARRLMEIGIMGKFPYRHIIVDEGQDFGREKMDENLILERLYDALKCQNDDGSTFYVFYDRLQIVQSRKLPSFIENSDCRLTLYRNCRNTMSIAKTAFSLFRDRNPDCNGVTGKVPRIHFLRNDSCEDTVDAIIMELKNAGIDDIVILTCVKENASGLAEFVRNGTYKNECHFSTVRKFKGLEADAVILIDLNEAIFENEGLLFYVGCSRARIRLEIVTDMDDSGCLRVMKNLSQENDTGKNPMRLLVSRLSCLGS